MNSELQAPSLADFSVAISNTAYQKRADALALSAPITTVSTVQEQQDCIVAMGFLKGLINGMESTRKEIKAPVLKAGELVDQTAKTFNNPMDVELDRLQKLASDFQAIENKRLAAIRDEQDRQAREAADKADAERRLYLAAIANADDVTREALQRAADKAAERNSEEARARQQAIVAIPPARAAGARVKVANDYEVLDVHALYMARPDLVDIEPKRGLLKAAVQIPGASIPGVRIFEAVTVSAKAT